MLPIIIQCLFFPSIGHFGLTTVSYTHLETLKVLKEKGKYKLVVATKGDLLDQESKLGRSGLASYFDHIEVMSDKTEKEYQRMLNILQIAPSEFVMIGN